MKGKCLCGEVQFEVTGSVPHLYRCHCSLCRKATGSSANAATFVHEKNFLWLAGAEKISSFVRESGYRSDFCSNCGSPVPNRLRQSDKYWVPAGLLEDFDGFEVTAHLHTASKAAWDSIDDAATQYEKMPDLEKLYGLLQRRVF